MSKIKKFVLMGVTAFATVGGFALMAATVTQDQLYDKIVSQPLDGISAQMGFSNAVKDKYQGFIKSDKEFLTNFEVPKEYVALDVVLKEHTLVDKALYPLMKLGEFVFNLDDNQKGFAQQRYLGVMSSYYSFRDNDNKLVNDYIMLGINALDKKSIDIYDSLYKVFGQDEQKMTSFIYFHEFGHKIGEAMLSEKSHLKTIIHQFETQKGVVLSQEDRKMIVDQYSETFADTFSLLLMSQKYPEMDIKKAQNLISGMRISIPEDDHITSPGVVNFESKEKMTLDEILKTAQNSALVTTQFYSETSFTDEKHVDARYKPIVLIETEHKSIRDKIMDSRERFLAVKSQKILDSYKN